MNSIKNMFPVGYEAFHENESFNFQLNRFYSQGVFRKEELMDIGRQIDGFETWISLFIKLGEEAEAEAGTNEGEEALALLLRAATCFRAAQFYTISGEKDAEGRSLKHALYERCRALYDAYSGSFQGISYVQIPFSTYMLPVWYAKAEEPRGNVLVCGGYDSIAQEFLVLLLYLQERGYNVYFFEGPGQGEVLMRYDARMTPEWEHCTAAVLDHFGLDDVTFIGVSLGGYLAPRAAACDKRITRLVMYDLIYDFYGSIIGKMGEKKGRFFDWMVSHPKNLIWRWLDRKLEENYFTRWLLGQGYAIYENVHTPCEYFEHIKKYNTREISPLLTQDVLVLAGESDLYTRFYKEQLAALTNARSVTGRLFTKEEQADHHCQIGNMGLLLETISGWIEEKTNGQKSGA
jgi:pimeloyl-ACP methyl ester carboxylesterase